MGFLPFRRIIGLFKVIQTDLSSIGLFGLDDAMHKSMKHNRNNKQQICIRFGIRDIFSQLNESKFCILKLWYEENNKILNSIKTNAF